MKWTEKELFNKKITIMGLGLHGGGLAAAKFCAESGAQVTVTDLRSPEVLAPSIKALEDYSIRYVLEKHNDSDFTDADIVIKNPAVPVTSPYLKLARQIETDISLFLRLTDCPIIAVTGSKGKSSTVSAMYHILSRNNPEARLGGNITVSPLTFISEIRKKPAPVILELSSWQLADLRGKNLLKPKVSLITNILPDHQNRYNGLEDYADDKREIYRSQSADQFTLCGYGDRWGESFYKDTPARGFWFSSTPPAEEINAAYLKNLEGFIRIDHKEVKILPEKLAVQGDHQRLNLLCAAAALSLFGLTPEQIIPHASTFSGIAHRLELVGTHKGIEYYNDSAATIPQAVIAAVSSFKTPVHLIMGGTDKELDFTVFEEAAGQPTKIYLLEGTATDKIIPLLKKWKISYEGPFSNLESAVRTASTEAEKACEGCIILSPGCASFGMFLNEFDRGDQFRELVKRRVE